MLWLYDFISIFIVILFSLIVLFLIWILMPDKRLECPEYQRRLARGEVSFLEASGITHQNVIELIWTLIPVAILTIIAAPSFDLLYYYDAVSNPVITVKVCGNQWYWSYDVPPQSYYESPEQVANYDYLLQNDITSLEPLFLALRQDEEWLEVLRSMAIIGVDSVEEEDGDSFMIDVDELVLGEYRLLTGEPTIRLPVGVHIRFVITATDVLHSFALPALGVKLDATPGRSNQCDVYVTVPGVYYGQCSELCGVGHGFMPIRIEFVDLTRE